MLFNAARLDRRAVACALTFGLITPYMLLPVGFGAIFHDIVASNMTQNGLTVDASLLPKAMLLPVLGMIAGLLFAMMISYRKPRDYAEGCAPASGDFRAMGPPAARRFAAGAGIAAIAAMLAVQLSTGSMIYGAAAGLAVLLLSRVMPRGRADRVLSDGMRSMAYIGFVMMSAAGLGRCCARPGTSSRS